MEWEDEIWGCRKHPSRPCIGVCPFCLRDRLLLLCPECAHGKPCLCAPPSTSSSSSSFATDLHRSSSVSAIGAVGRVSNLIESEPAFRQSQSVGISTIRSASVAGDPRRREEKRWIAVLWPFWRSRKKASMAASVEKLERSTLVNVSGSKARRWHFRSPMKAFQHQKTTRVVQECSPLRRG